MSATVKSSFMNRRLGKAEQKGKDTKNKKIICERSTNAMKRNAIYCHKSAYNGAMLIECKLNC